MENNIQTTSFAICRLPNESEVFVFKGISKTFSSLDELNTELNFIISPFNEPNTYLNIPFSHKTTPSEITFPSDFIFRKGTDIGTTQKHYQEIVQTAVNAMKEKTYSKIVLATNNIQELNQFNPLAFFHSILNDFPTAFVYCISSPETGTWFGATPEPLLVGNGKQFNTIALAGTMPIENEGQPWGNKEKVEQKLVETYIEDILSTVSNQVTLNGPNTKKAGNLIHLATSFHFELTNGTINELLLKLHPTPAIAGLPKDIALKEISRLENFPRSYYAGLLGIYSKNFVQLFVNLRCMEWNETTATLYAGAGITEDSDPSAEWNETRKKMRSLGKFLS